MIKSLTIRNYRSIVDAKLELGRVNLFIGPNGAGKSNVLEAVGVLSASLARGLDADTLAQRGVRLSLPRMFKSAFAGRKLPTQVALEADLRGEPEVSYGLSFTASDESVALQYHTEFLREGGEKVLGRAPRSKRLHRPATAGLDESKLGEADPQRSLWDAWGVLAQVAPETRAALAGLATFGIYAPETGVLRGTSTENRARVPLGLAGSGLAAAFGTMVSRLDPSDMQNVASIIWLSGWADHLRIGKRDPGIVPAGVATGDRVLYLRDRFMHHRRNMLSTFDASEGTLYLAFIATLLAHPDTPPILAIDNIDNALNPALVQKLVRHVAHMVTDDTPATGPVCQQVLMTSHHPTALDGLDLFNPEHRLFVVWRDEKKGRGATSFFRVQPPPGMTREEWVLEKHGEKLSKLLIDGQIPHALGAQV